MVASSAVIEHCPVDNVQVRKPPTDCRKRMSPKVIERSLSFWMATVTGVTILPNRVRIE